MELDWFENVGSAAEMLQVDADNDTSMFEDERCGLCMLDIIDRGVLDCCQHWFCFKCIDDWSTITNLCPLCHSEFQLITCVPVIDTIGGNNTDEDSLSRNNDWSVEGKNNTLSFPSYYIDENAVTCLDGDGCKLRSDSFTLEENLAFDTSIACDSCDTWYHAFCVGFDAESTVESWLCPRCLIDEARKVEASASELAQTQHYSGVAGNQCSTDTFSGKVSISVADDGETAMVVSLVEQKHLMEEPSEKSLTTKCLEFEKEDYINQPKWETPETSSDNPPVLTTQNATDYLPSSREGDVGLSISMDMALGSIHSNHNSKSNFEDNAMFNLHNVSSIKRPQSIDKRTSEDDATLRPDEGSIVAGFSESTQVDSDELQHCSLPGDSCHFPVDGSNAQADIPVVLGEKRRRKGHSAHATERKRVRLATERVSRETNAIKNAERTSDIGLPDSVSLSNSQEAGHSIMSSRNVSVGLESAEEETALDIMSIVQGTESKILRSNPANKLSERRDAAKPRVKKIMRRPVEDNESTAMVQTLGKEIREAISHKSSEDIGKNIVDKKLLAAFRAAVSVPDAEPVKKVSASVVKANRLMLQKSKTRENLTKKIYATSSGKRRHSWYRDCEVEFWKHRCPKTTKHEKIETLKSVLSLLKWDPEAKKAEENPKEGGSSSILSRLYLADASVFPRKDDIQPLAVLDNTKADKTDTTPSLSSVPLTSNSSCSDSKMSKSTSSSFKTAAVTSKGAQIETEDKSINNIQKVKIDKSEDIKTDKRKWALQVLARKAESNSTRPGHQKQEEDPALKGNYPLLAQLPLDMRPKLESFRHNKFSNSVRQAQLNCIAENLLKLTNISPIRKTAATELAVADAVNIEREIAQKSNSKAVYMNLCSQELRRQKSTYSQSAVDDPNPSTLVKVSTEGEPSSSPPALDPEVEKALKSAGLLSDDDNDDDDDDDDGDDEEAKGKGPENVLEMDSHPELDIYGEFEYDIEDEDYIGASMIKDAKLQTEEGESKMKVVFSTLATETALNSERIDGPSDELVNSCVSQSDCKTDANDENSTKANNEECLSLPPDSTTERAEEPTPTECEELYGPDREPLFETIPFNNLALAPTNSDAKVTRKAQTKENENVDKQQQQHEIDDSVTKKLGIQVQSYIKEHIRPLCKSGVITVDQYRWAVGKTTDKVMRYHSKAKNANFLIKEGEKVKKLAEQYVEAAKVKDKDK